MFTRLPVGPTSSKRSPWKRLSPYSMIIPSVETNNEPAQPSRLPLIGCPNPRIFQPGEENESHYTLAIDYVVKDHAGQHKMTMEAGRDNRIFMSSMVGPTRSIRGFLQSTLTIISTPSSHTIGGVVAASFTTIESSWDYAHFELSTFITTTFFKFRLCPTVRMRTSTTPGRMKREVIVGLQLNPPPGSPIFG